MSFRMSCPKCGTRNYNITRDVRTSAAQDAVAGLVYSCRCGKQMFGDAVVKEHERQQREFEESSADRSAEDHARRQAELDEQRRQAQLQEAFDYRREFVARRQAEDAAREEARRVEEDRAWRERIAKVAGDDDDDVVRPVRPPRAAPKAPPARPAAPPPAAKPAKPVAKPVAPPLAEQVTPASTPAPAAASKPAEPSDDDDGEDGGPCAWHECDKMARPRSKYCSRECSNKNARLRHKQRRKDDVDAA